MLGSLELPQVRYSAFCGGRLVKALLSERGWTGMVQEDLGPAGHAYKWTCLYTDSTWIMHKKKGDKAEDFKRYVGLVPLFIPCLNKAEHMGGATLEHLATMIRDDIMMR
eukprot:3626820-Pyramimonas_sp.AAC.1